MPEEPSGILLLPEDVEALGSVKTLHDDLRRGWYAKSTIAGVRQAQLAKAFTAADPVHHEGLGQLIGVVEPWIYEEIRRQHGRDCWRDRTFRREFFAANPECAVRSRSRKTTFRVNGLRKSADACTGGAIVCP